MVKEARRLIGKHLNEFICRPTGNYVSRHVTDE
jgi:hypothetical protein